MTPYQIVVLLSQRRRILQQMHYAKICAHFCFTKTLNKIRQNYYWPELHSDVRTYISVMIRKTRQLGKVRTEPTEKRDVNITIYLQRRLNFRKSDQKQIRAIQVFPFKKGTNSGVVEKTVPTNSEELGNLTVNLYLVLSTNKVD